jgi:hypothetical protein
MRTHRELLDGGYGCGYLSRDNGTHAAGQKSGTAREREKAPLCGAFPVRLSGACSNPRVAQRLDVAARRHMALMATGLTPRPRSRGTLRLRVGVIQREVLGVLGQATGPLPPREIHDLVERRLARPVSYDTVSSFPSVAARDAASGVVRKRRGLYSV